MLRLVLPKGSLERATFDLFEAADLSVIRSSAVDYRASIDDPRVDEVRILRPQEIAGYVAEGLFDMGITGRDWVEETGAEVESLGELHYSKATSNPVKVVVAVAGDFSSAGGETGLRLAVPLGGRPRRLLRGRFRLTTVHWGSSCDGGSSVGLRAADAHCRGVVVAAGRDDGLRGDFASASLVSSGGVGEGTSVGGGRKLRRTGSCF